MSCTQTVVRHPTDYYGTLTCVCHSVYIIFIVRVFVCTYVFIIHLISSCYLVNTSTTKSSLFSGLSFTAEVNFWCPLKTIVSCDQFIIIIIRECGSSLYVELARTAPPTNTNFRLTFLLTRLQEALYEDLAV